MTIRRLPLSAPRRIIAELSHLSLRVPRCLMSARISVARARAARDAAPAPRIPWTVIFAKAYGLASRRDPVLRRFHAAIPGPHLIELPDPIACLMIERLHEGEPSAFFARFRAPDAIPLRDFAARLSRAKTGPVEAEPSMRRMLRFARFPWPLRRLLFRYALAAATPLARMGGSFAVSALGSQGAAIHDSVSVLPAFLSYGPIGADGMVEVHIAFDHRVMDGADGARALRALEAMIEGPVADELLSLSG